VRICVPLCQARACSVETWSCHWCDSITSPLYVAHSRQAFRFHLQTSNYLDLEHIQVGDRRYDWFVELDGERLQARLHQAQVCAARCEKRRQQLAAKRAAEEHGGVAAENVDMSLPDGGKPVEHSVPVNTGYVWMMTLNPPPSFRALAAPKGYRPERFKPEDASSSDSEFDTDSGNS
jgi:hypothetical protein